MTAARCNRITVGARVQIADRVTRTAWGPPCNWGGKEGTVTGGGGRVSGHRIWRVALEPDRCFNGNDFAEDVLELVPGWNLV